jgi:hypothetical protein
MQTMTMINPADLPTDQSLCKKSVIRLWFCGNSAALQDQKHLDRLKPKQLNTELMAISDENWIYHYIPQTQRAL